MVSLFDISIQKPLWSHLTSGVPTLDLMLRLQNDAILDFQTVPANSAFSAMLCSLLVSHLSLSEALSVVVIETINLFPWSLLHQHPLFKFEWIEEKKIVTYPLSTFAQLYSFFAFPTLPRNDPGSVLLLVTNFHELVEFYRLQLAATHEELLLKHQIDKNRVLLENLTKATEEGPRSIKLPPVPSVSRDNPYTKVQAHINGLMLMISDFTFKTSSVVLLTGHLEPRFWPVFRKDNHLRSSTDTSLDSSQILNSRAPSAPFVSNKDSSRLVLTPVTLGPAPADKISTAEAKITARLVFYNDWFYKSSYFTREHRRVQKHDLFFVSVVKVFNLNGIKNINDPVYFHFGQLPVNLRDVQTPSGHWLVDLLEPEKEQEALPALIQNSITYLQVPLRELVVPSGSPYDIHGRSSNPEFLFPIRKSRKIFIPSSPPYMKHTSECDVQNENSEGSAEEETEESEVEDANEAESRDDTGSGSDLESNDFDETGDEIEREEAVNGLEGSVLSEMRIVPEYEALFIDGSDVESTGTLFEDMDNSQPEWFIRHM